eukprot:TRINITY_DN3052_c0_g1_i1.p1 TRINITY_DN3052_c0_g1~~TRINITY_DN3052_c0_g1_i1.p1  ORF type:complete len:540 (+),score=76.37 TRINITY_DN3052_c0_g1_i1:47-1621(+)
MLALTTPFAFCIDRWVTGSEKDTTLPQKDPQIRTRMREMERNLKNEKPRTLQIKVRPTPQPDEEKETWKGVEEVDRKYNDWGFKLPKVALKWSADTRFGRERFNGLSPTLVNKIQSIHDIPERMHGELEEDMVMGFLDDFTTLEEATTAGRLYIVDLSFLRAVPTVSNPILLLYLNDANDILPIAIQMSDKELNVHTPNDNVFSWNSAKLRYHQAELIWKIVGLKSCAHEVMAEVSRGTKKHLSPRHPVRQILNDFLQHAEQAETDFEGLFLSSTSEISSILPDLQTRRSIRKLARTSFDFERNSYKATMVSCGVTDTNLEYPYMDDGVLLWGAFEAYSKNVVSQYYQKPADLTGDFEINNWIATLRRSIKGLPYLRDYTVDPLVFVITNVMWTCSAWHTAWRGDLYPSLAYVLWSPLSVKPLPLTMLKHEYTRDTLASLIPSPREAKLQVQLVMAMASRYCELEPLMKEGRVFGDERAQAHHDKFVAELRKIEELIQLKNNEREPDAVYTCMLPSAIRTSLCV